MRPVPHRKDNPNGPDLLTVFAAPVTPSVIYTPGPRTNQRVQEIDSRYRSVASRGPFKLSAEPNNNLRQNTDRVWYAQGRSTIPLGQRPRGGQPGYMPSRPANNPNTKFLGGGNAILPTRNGQGAMQPTRAVNPYGTPVLAPPTAKQVGGYTAPAVAVRTPSIRMQRTRG